MLIYGAVFTGRFPIYEEIPDWNSWKLTSTILQMILVSCMESHSLVFSEDSDSCRASVIVEAEQTGWQSVKFRK